MSAHASNPTNAYTVPSVSITTARTGASSKANALGRRWCESSSWSDEAACRVAVPSGVPALGAWVLALRRLKSAWPAVGLGGSC